MTINLLEIKMFKCKLNSAPDCVMRTKISDDIWLTIENVNLSLAHMHFANSSYAQVDVPSGIDIFDDTDNTRMTSVEGKFSFYYTKSYRIVYKSEVILQLRRKFSWGVYGSADKEVEVIDY